MVATGGEMKGLLVFLLVTLAAATALAYGHSDVADVVSQASWPSEPAALLLSGSALLGVAGLVRRYTL
jgi:hypothetical protein